MPLSWLGTSGQERDGIAFEAEGNSTTAGFAGVPGTLVCLAPRWDVPLWTNRHHVMSRLSRRQPVLFVATGYHLPRIALQQLRERGRRGFLDVFRLRPVGDGLVVMQAWNLVPRPRRAGISARLNSRVVAWQIRRALHRLGTDCAVLWTYDPASVYTMERLDAPLRVYHCVDDHAAQIGGARGAYVRRAEERLLASVDIVFTTASSLAERLGDGHDRVHVLPNVADYDHFARARELAPDEALTGLPEGRAVFVGAFNETKVDLDLLEALAYESPDIGLVLIGPATAASDEYRRRLDSLASRSNVRLLGAKPYTDLPRYLAGARVGLIPYRKGEYTRGVFPMKVYEYMSGGLPVVAAGLPELADVPGVALADDAAGFVAAVRAAIEKPPSPEELSAEANANTWETRLARMDALARETVSDDRARPKRASG